MTTSSGGGMRPSALGLIVLAMLIEEPMHVYRMQKLIKERGKDKVVNVRQRTSLHQVIDRLAAHGLVNADKQDMSQNSGRRVYQITATGRQAALGWLSAMVTSIPDEFPQFPAALSVLTMVGPDTATRLITERTAAINDLLDTLRADHAKATVPRVYLLEDEYRARVLQAEAEWLTQILHDIGDGALDWQAPPPSTGLQEDR